MVKDGGALAPTTSIGPGAATAISADAAGGVPRYGVTPRDGNNDRLSTLWREVISLAGVARSFSKASSYRSANARNSRRDIVAIDRRNMNMSEERRARGAIVATGRRRA